MNDVHGIRVIIRNRWERIRWKTITHHCARLKKDESLYFLVQNCISLSWKDPALYEWNEATRYPERLWSPRSFPRWRIRLICGCEQNKASWRAMLITTWKFENPRDIKFNSKKLRDLPNCPLTKERGNHCYCLCPSTCNPFFLKMA